MIDVTILVMGGAVEPENIPAGVRIRIRDYDVDGVPEDELLEDECGQYVLTVWEN